MTELQKYRQEYGPTRLGITRLLASLFTLIGGVWLMVWFLNHSLWPDMRYLTPWDHLVMTMGGVVLIVVCLALSVIAAWAWLGFKKPIPFIQRVWRINRKGYFSVHCWLKDGELQYEVVSKDQALQPPEGSSYSLLIPLARMWGAPVIYRWVDMGTRGLLLRTVCIGLSVRVVVAREEWSSFEKDMVWLGDQTGNRKLATLQDALGFWIPEALHGTEHPSLATPVRRLQSTASTLAKELARKEDLHCKGVAELVRRRRLTSALDELFKDALASMNAALASYDRSRRRSFHREAQSLFAELRRERDLLHECDRKLSAEVTADLRSSA